MTNHEQFESSGSQIPLIRESFSEVYREISSRPGPGALTRSQTDLVQAIVENLPNLAIVDDDRPAPTEVVQQNTLPPRDQPALSPEQINNLIRGEHGLGSPNFREREAAQMQLIRAGADALPAVLNALHDRTDLPLEVRRRLESFSASMLNDRFNDLIAATRNNDPAIARAAEVMISRETTDSLLSRTTHSEISPANQRILDGLIRTRLNDTQLQSYLQEPAFGWTEADLRRAVAAERILGQPTDGENQLRLGVAILGRPNHTPAEQQYAERLLTAYTQNGRDPVHNATAHRLLASSAFQRGDTNEGMRLMRNSMQLINGALGQTKREDVVHELQNISDLAAARNDALSPAQRQELTAISRRATETGLAFVRARQEWLEQSNRMGQRLE